MSSLFRTPPSLVRVWRRVRYVVSRHSSARARETVSPRPIFLLPVRSCLAYVVVFIVTALPRFALPACQLLVRWYARRAETRSPGRISFEPDSVSFARDRDRARISHLFPVSRDAPTAGRVISGSWIVDRRRRIARFLKQRRKRDGRGDSGLPLDSRNRRNEVRVNRSISLFRSLGHSP